LIARDYADGRRAAIDLDHAKAHGPGQFPGFTPRPPGGVARPGSSTHHISVVDAAGNAVAVTCSVEQRYGSAVVVPGTGSLLNNQLTDFDAPGTANEARPGKRPRSNMSPVIVVAGDRAEVVLGASGGLRIPMGVATVISNIVDFGMDPALAVDAARLDAEQCCTVELEGDRVPEAERQELTRRGHTIVDRTQYNPQFVPLVQVAGIRADGRHGSHGVGLKQVAAESGAPIGSLYHFFPGGKDELAAEALQLSGHGYQVLVEGIFESAPDLISGIQAAFAGAAEVLEASGYTDACWIETVALEVASSNEPLRLVTAEIFERWIDAATRLVEAG